jgi:hypothetical protein
MSQSYQEDEKVELCYTRLEKYPDIRKINNTWRASTSLITNIALCALILVWFIDELLPDEHKLKQQMNFINLIFVFFAAVRSSTGFFNRFYGTYSGWHAGCFIFYLVCSFIIILMGWCVSLPFLVQNADQFDGKKVYWRRIMVISYYIDIININLFMIYYGLLLAIERCKKRCDRKPTFLLFDMGYTKEDNDLIL